MRPHITDSHHCPGEVTWSQAGRRIGDNTLVRTEMGGSMAVLENNS